MSISSKFLKISVMTFLMVLNAACSSTAIMDSWRENDIQKTFHHPMIIAISDSQQTRRIFENYFVAELKPRDVDAIPSYQLISSKQKIDRETVVAAVKGTDIDAVIVTYLVSTDSRTIHPESPLDTTYSGNSENLQVSSTLISTRGRTTDAEIVTLKSDLYDVESRELIWSTQTRSTAPESIDKVVTEVVGLLIGQLADDGFIK